MCIIKVALVIDSSEIDVVSIKKKYHVSNYETKLGKMMCPYINSSETAYL